MSDTFFIVSVAVLCKFLLIFSNYWKSIILWSSVRIATDVWWKQNPVSLGKAWFTGHQRGAGDPPAVREQGRLSWVNLCVMSSELKLQLTGLPSWIYSQPGHAENCMLNLFRAIRETQVWTVSECVCALAAGQQHLQGMGNPLNMSRNSPGDKPLWGRHLSHWKKALQMSTNKISRPSLRIVHYVGGSFKHDISGKYIVKVIFTRDRTTMHVIFVIQTLKQKMTDDFRSKEWNKLTVFFRLTVFNNQMWPVTTPHTPGPWMTHVSCLEECVLIKPVLKKTKCRKRGMFDTKYTWKGACISPL